MTSRRSGARPVNMRPEEIDSYSAACRYLNSHINLERVRRLKRNDDAFKLDYTLKILDAIGHPEEHSHHVHVAGTKGKGSTVAMLDAALRGCGFTVGTYSSPHLVDVCERIRLNGENIPKQDFAACMRDIAFAIASLNRDDPPHFFEILTTMAFRYFAEKAVDLSLIEVGLGGRLDCTNVVTPEVSVITQISYDHADILGDSLAQIAREKAGILKRGVPAISAPQDPEVEAVLRDVAEYVGTGIQFLEKEIEFTKRYQTSDTIGTHVRICVTTPHSEYEHVVVPLAGLHQAINCGLALATLDVLKGRGFDIDDTAAAANLANTRIEGRMELLPGPPDVLIDGAHNEASIEALLQAIGAHVRPDSLVVVFGCSMDKDIDGMLTALARGADKVIFTRTRANPRAADPQELADRYIELDGHMAQSAPTLPEALDIATRAASSGDLIAVTGSFFLVGEARKLLIDRVKRADAIEAESGVLLPPVARLTSLRRI